MFAGVAKNVTKSKSKNSAYFPISNVKGDLYFGKGAGQHLKKDMDNAKLSIRVISPYISLGFFNYLISKSKFSINTMCITENAFLYGGTDYKKATQPLYQQRRAEPINIVKNRKKKRILFLLFTILFFTLSALLVSASIFTVVYSLIKLNTISNDTTIFYLLLCFLFFLFSISAAMGIHSKYKKAKNEKDKYSYNLNSVFQLLICKKGINLHSNIYLIDDRVAYIGSFNLSENGFFNNLETVLKITDTETINEILKYYEFLFHTDYYLCDDSVGEWCYQEH